ncbi:MAG: SMI1/KNR4 family protein [Proteobacteria bacterium]|nr:SMI1/KNR4 family protein [Pseudomonadota bacterium]
MDAQDFFTADERTTLRAHGIVLFAQRVIFDARPPMPQAQIDAVQALCAGPLTAGLLALWRETAGGQLDYDLRLRMGGNEEAVSWSELFWNGSDGYRDLQGWIDHELELAEEAAEEDGAEWDGKLSYLPIGGFEYLDRIYVIVDALHPANGTVLAWKKGLPAAWQHRLHEDSLATLADSVEGAFAALHLDEDPLAPTGDHFSGQALLEYLDERHESHGLALELSDKLVAFYRQAMRDWRGALQAGTLAEDAGLAHIALRHAIHTDDAALVRALAGAGIGLDAPLQGSANAVDLAVGHGAWSAAAALLDAGAPVADDVLDSIDHALAPELTARLLAAGAQPDADAMAQCVACGAPASARLIGEALQARGEDVPRAFDAARAKLLEDLEGSLAKVREGRLSHYLGAEGLIKRAEHLRAFEW